MNNPLLSGFGHFGGTQVVVSSLCDKETTRRHFPESRHRSARITKKLIRRYGGIFVREPAAYMVGNKLYCHPALYAQMCAKIGNF